jgi:hypothetical protein
MRCAGMRCAKRGMVQLCPCVHRWWNIRELRCAMRGGTQLRLQARRGSTRGGLAGRSRACKHCSGLALPRADGEHHRARGMGASSKAREGVLCQTPRRGLIAGRNRPLEEGCYWDKRERERERDASAMLRHLPTGVFWRTPTLLMSVPKENKRKQPLMWRSGSLSLHPLISA